MRIGIRLKLFLVSLALILLSVAAADAYVTRSLASQVTATIRGDQPTDLEGVVQIVMGLFRDRAGKKGVALATKMAPLPGFETDQRAVEQVLTNLVENAIKYCPAGARVEVAASKAADLVKITVTDTGPGIARHHLPRLFERFYRVDAGRSRDIGGTGLGLSIVKHLVDALGGSVSVTSEVGKGSTFTVLLPCERGGCAAPLCRELSLPDSNVGA